MKTKFSIIKFIAITPLLLLNCNKQTTTNDNSDKSYLNEDGTEKFTLEKKKFSNFIVLSSSIERDKSPESIVYVLKGSLKNNTKNIYKAVSLESEIILLLENENQLSCNKIDSNFDLSSIANSKTIYNWKPNETWTIDEIKSCIIPVEYFNYPVKQVFTLYYMYTEDQVNNKSEKILVSQNDVTEKWLKAKEKVRKNISDCSDYSYELSRYLENK